MKRLKITSVLLSAAICMSLIATPVSVLADETTAPSESQSTEAAETKEPEASKAKVKEIEKKETTSSDSEESEPSKVTESDPGNDHETEPTQASETEPIEESVTESTNNKKTEEPIPTTTEKEETSETGNKEASADKKVTPEVEETTPTDTAKKKAKNTIGISGTWGDNITYTLDDTGKLIISGTGDMTKNDWGTPWSHDSFIKSIVINEGVTSICNNAFTDSVNIESIVIPNTIKKIDSRAFENCSSLKSVSFPSGLEYIGSEAFKNCSSLTSVSFPSGLKSVGYKAFEGCKGLKSVNISNAEFIDAAFLDCTGLTSVTIESGVTKIQYSTFSGCTSLKSVTIPLSLVGIWGDAFEDCNSLSDIYYEGNEKEWKNLVHISSGNDAVLNANKHFAPIPTSGKCGDNLTWTYKDNTLTISGTGDMYDYPYRTLSGPTGEYKDKAPWAQLELYISSIVIKDGVASVGNDAFEGCKVNSIIIPDSVTSIGDCAFWECGYLRSIEIPNSVKSLGIAVFTGCDYLTRLDLPDGLTSIPDGTFQGCSDLAKIKIPKSVTSIGRYAFYSCYDLKDIYFSGTEEEWKNISIDSTNTSKIENCNIHFEQNTIPLDENTLKVTGGKTAKIKYKKLKKKKQTVTIGKMMTVSDAQGKVTYKIVSVNKKKSSFKINATTGTVTVKKKLKKGTYTLKVSVTAAGNDNYMPATKTVSFKIKVK